ncbi:MAG: Hsp20/alpha crystallin family protein [Chitinophagaceae bacterium]|nr:Hsp20/alpha crystallin family protein [Chitinophagaceae bacterium]
MTQLRLNRRPVDMGFNNLLNDFFGEWPVYDRRHAYGKWDSAPVNILETENGYRLSVVAPGFDRNDFKVAIEDNILTISAEKEEKKTEENDQKEKWVRNEYRFKSFKRSFTLDEKIETGGIEAKYENGVLTLNLPKKTDVKPSVKQISIQ